MACSWLVFILVHLFLDIEEIYGCDLEFQNLNASITLESNQTVGEAVFTLTINGEDTLSPDITLRTESVYFELDPTDNRRVLAKTCLPAGLTETLIFHLHDHSGGDDGVLMVTVEPTVPIYNSPSTVQVPVGSDTHELDVFEVGITNSGECTSFLCDVVCKNEDKIFWIDKGTRTVRIYTSGLRYDFEYNLEVRCFDSTVKKTTHASADNRLQIGVTFTDAVITDKTRTWITTQTYGKPQSILFEGKDDLSVIEDNNDPYEITGNDAELSMSEDYEGDYVGLKREKRSPTSTIWPGFASNVSYAVVNVKPRCFCNGNFPRLGPNGFYIRKYRPVSVAGITVPMTSGPTSSTSSTASTQESTTSTDTTVDSTPTTSSMTTSMPTTLESRSTTSSTIITQTSTATKSLTNEPTSTTLYTTTAPTQGTTSTTAPMTTSTLSDTTLTSQALTDTQHTITNSTEKITSSSTSGLPTPKPISSSLISATASITTGTETSTSSATTDQQTTRTLPGVTASTHTTSTAELYSSKKTTSTLQGATALGINTGMDTSTTAVTANQQTTKASPAATSSTPTGSAPISTNELFTTWKTTSTPLTATASERTPVTKAALTATTYHETTKTTNLNSTTIASTSTKSANSATSTIETTTTTTNTSTTLSDITESSLTASTSARASATTRITTGTAAVIETSNQPTTVSYSSTTPNNITTTQSAATDSSQTSQSGTNSSQVTTQSLPAPNNTGKIVDPDEDFFDDMTNLIAVVCAGGITGIVGIGIMIYKCLMSGQCHAAAVGSGSTDEDNGLGDYSPAPVSSTTNLIANTDSSTDTDEQESPESNNNRCTVQSKDYDISILT